MIKKIQVLVSKDFGWTFAFDKMIYTAIHLGFYGLHLKYMATIIRNLLNRIIWHQLMSSNKQG